jgi:hypothetical protein
MHVYTKKTGSRSFSVTTHTLNLSHPFPCSIPSHRRVLEVFTLIIFNVCAAGLFAVRFKALSKREQTG